MRVTNNEEFLLKVSETNKDVVILSDYVNSKVKVKVKYKSCGHIGYKTPSKIYEGQSCGLKECSNKKQSSTKLSSNAERISKRLKDMGYVLLSDYKGTERKHLLRNTKCNHEYEATIDNVLHGSGCPICHGMKDTETFKELIYSKYPNKYEVLGEYVNNRTPVRVTHLNCGHTWRVIPKDLLYSERCPNCISSKGEMFVRDWLESNGIQNEPQFRFPDCRDKLALPFDFKVQIGDRIGLIEFDGAQHFGNSNFWGDKSKSDGIKRRDNIKNEYCQKNKIPLLRIPYWWIRNDRAKRELQAFIENL